MTTDERKKTAAAYVEAAAGRLPVVVQVGHSSVTEARELAEWTRMAALCARARIQDRLNQIAVAQKYGWPQKHPQASVVARF